jgi:hypothetical protein
LQGNIAGKPTALAPTFRFVFSVTKNDFPFESKIAAIKMVSGMNFDII